MSLFEAKRLFLVICFVLLTGKSFAMGLDVYEDLKENSRGILKVYINGVGEGYSWSNSLLKDRGDEVFYCPPHKIALNADNYISIIDDKVASLGRSEAEDLPIALILYFGLIETFPCSD